MFLLILKRRPLEPDHDQDVPSDVLQGTALTSQDWHKAQSLDNNISVIIDSIIEGKRPLLKTTVSWINASS